jgi:NlpC/P60 family putative phage cell wall peptidase
MRARIVAEARRWIGTPYRHQASLRGVGCDCLGLVRGVWREVIGAEAERPPAYTPDWAEALQRDTLLIAARTHMREVAVEAARPGDVLLFRLRPGAMAKHLAILTEADAMLHAAEGAPAAEAPLCAWWRRRIAAAFAFPGAN